MIFVCSIVHAFYNLLFASVHGIPCELLGTRILVAETGAVCVLHTWGQNLSLHPHLHCIVPAAGFTLAGNWKMIGSGGKYFIPLTLLSIDFRSYFMKKLKAWLIKQNLLLKYQQVLDKAWKKSWVVHCEPSMAKAEHVVKYLGNYTHRVAISNSRILNIDDKSVTFLHKDYADSSRQKPITLDGVEFLRRFCMHILPKRFVKIRRFGIYSSAYKSIIQKLKPKPGIEKMIKEPVRERLLRLTGFDLSLCPVCKQGQLHRIEEIPKVRSPTGLYALISIC